MKLPILGALLLAACVATPGDENPDDPGCGGKCDGPSSASGKLVSQGYHFVSKHTYPAPSCDSLHPLCIAAREGTSHVTLSRYEHPDGRIAYTTTTDTYGPVRAGGYLSSGVWSVNGNDHHGHALVDVKDFVVTPAARTLTADFRIAQDDLGPHPTLWAGTTDNTIATIPDRQLDEGAFATFIESGRLNRSSLDRDGTISGVVLVPDSAGDVFTEQVDPADPTAPLPGPLASAPADTWFALRAPQLDARSWALTERVSTGSGCSGSKVATIRAVTAHAESCASTEPMCSPSTHRRFYVDLQLGGQAITLAADHRASFTSNENYDAIVYKNGTTSVAIEDWGRPVAATTDTIIYGPGEVPYGTTGSGAVTCAPRVAP